MIWHNHKVEFVLIPIFNVKYHTAIVIQKNACNIFYYSTKKQYDNNQVDMSFDFVRDNLVNPFFLLQQMKSECILKRYSFSLSKILGVLYEQVKDILSPPTMKEAKWRVTLVKSFVEQQNDYDCELFVCLVFECMTKSLQN